MAVLAPSASCRSTPVLTTTDGFAIGTWRRRLCTGLVEPRSTGWVHRLPRSGIRKRLSDCCVNGPSHVSVVEAHDGVGDQLQVVLDGEVARVQADQLGVGQVA